MKIHTFEVFLKDPVAFSPYLFTILYGSDLLNMPHVKAWKSEADTVYI